MHHANYQIISDRPEDPLIIRDIGPHTRYPTVTNDAEWVVARLSQERRLPNGRRLLYFDSENMLDEILVKDGRFAGFKVNRQEPR